MSIKPWQVRADEFLIFFSKANTGITHPHWQEQQKVRLWSFFSASTAELGRVEACSHTSKRHQVIVLLLPLNPPKIQWNCFLWKKRGMTNKLVNNICVLLFLLFKCRRYWAVSTSQPLLVHSLSILNSCLADASQLHSGKLLAPKGHRCLLLTSHYFRWSYLYDSSENEMRSLW